MPSRQSSTRFVIFLQKKQRPVAYGMLDSILSSVIQTLREQGVTAPQIPATLGVAIALVSWDSMTRAHATGSNGEEAKQEALSVLAEVQSLVAAWEPGADFQQEFRARFGGHKR